jgi:hypothetical protein
MGEHILLTKNMTIGSDTSVSTVKPAHVVTSIKQSPVLKGHLFLVPVIENVICIEPY